MEMAQTNGGKNPLTPLSNADFVALGQSISNLDPTRDDATFQKNLKIYADIYRRALLGVGVDLSQLDEETRAYLETLPKPISIDGTDTSGATQADPIAGEYRARLGRGETAGQIMAWLKSQGKQFDPRQIQAAVEFRRLHPNAPLEAYSFEDKTEQPFAKAATPPPAQNGWGAARVVE